MCECVISILLVSLYKVKLGSEYSECRTSLCTPDRILSFYTHAFVQHVVSDLDEQDKDDENEQIVKDSDSSNDDVDDLESKVTDVCQV